MAELKLRLISGGKSTRQQSLMQTNTPKTSLSLSKTLSSFKDNEARVDTLAEYDNIISVLRENNMSYKTRIVRHKRGPTQYYIILLEKL